nr:LysR family transcriptional regulator [Variovorax boronicumulans]
MDSLDLLRVFNEVAHLGSFSRAAEQLGLSKATVSKSIAALERRFGVGLLHRTTRAVTLTDAGGLLLDRSRPMLELAASTQAELEQRALTPKGRLRVTAPHGIDQTEIPALLHEFLEKHTQVQLSLLLTNRDVDLAAEAVDIALRAGPAANENLVERKLLRLRMAVCASPLYWKRHGTPSHPAELAAHNALINSDMGALAKWHFNDDGGPFDVVVQGRWDASEAGPLVQAALHGAGVVHLPVVLLQPYIASGRLVEVLGAFGRDDLWLAAVYLQHRHRTAAQRAFLQFLSSRFSEGK